MAFLDACADAETAVNYQNPEKWCGLGNNLVAVVLSDLRARGEAEANSNWDLFVIAHGLPQRSFQRHLHLKQRFPDLSPNSEAL